MSVTELVIVALVSLVGSFIKAVTGMGYPLIAIPVLTLAMGVETAVAVIAIPNVVANALLNWGVRHERSATRDLPVLLSAALVGGLIGTVALVRLPERPLVLGLAFTVFIYVIQSLRQPMLQISPRTTQRWSPLAGLLMGFSHGAVGASGPLVAIWLHGYRLSKNAYVFSVTALFLVGGLAQFLVLVVSGAFGKDRIIASLVALVATLAVIPAGTRVRGRIGGLAFERAILVLLVFSGISLLWRALGGGAAPT